METENLTDETLAGVEQNELATSDGGAADSSTGTVTLREVLNQALKKDFPDDETALKAVQDTFSYTGEYGKLKPLVDKLGGVEAVIKKMEQTPELSTSQAPSQEEKVAEVVTQLTTEPQSEFVTKKDLFFMTNPDHAQNRAIIEGLSSLPQNKGKSLEDVVASDDYKKYYDATKTSAEADASKSVLHSNSKLAEVSNEYATDFAKAKELNTPQAWAELAIKHGAIEIPKE